MDVIEGQLWVSNDPRLVNDVFDQLIIESKLHQNLILFTFPKATIWLCFE